MRITVDRADPDFIGEDGYGRYVIVFNGEALEDVVEADDRAGYVIVDMRNDAGDWDIDYVKMEVRQHKAMGSVKIIDTRPESTT